jgi:hypothetical protein
MHTPLASRFLNFEKLSLYDNNYASTFHVSPMLPIYFVLWCINFSRFPKETLILYEVDLHSKRSTPGIAFSLFHMPLAFQKSIFKIDAYTL